MCVEAPLWEILVLWNEAEREYKISPTGWIKVEVVCKGDTCPKKGEKRKKRKGKKTKRKDSKKEKKKNGTRKKVAPLSFSKARKSVENSVCWSTRCWNTKMAPTGKEKKRRKRWHLPALARKRESRKMAPTSLCPQIVSQQAPAPQTKALKLASKFVSHNSRDFSKCFCSTSWGESIQEPFKNHSSPQPSRSCWPSKPYWSSKPDVLRAHLWDAGIQSWVPSVGYKPFAPQGEA